MVREKEMALLRITKAEPLEDFSLRLTLTDGSVVERDLRPFLRGPIFKHIRTDASEFARVRAQDGSIAWPDGADLCPDALIWNGLPPDDESRPASSK